MNESTNQPATCAIYTWCEQVGNDHADHSGFRWTTAATADREEFSSNEHCIEVPTVTVYLSNDTEATTSPAGASVAISVGLPRGRQELTAEMTLFEAELLAERLASLLAQAAR